MKKILVPTDFSEQASNAIHFAAGIARKQEAEIVLLHVVEHPYGSSFSSTGSWDVENYEGEEKLFILKMMEKGKAQLDETLASETLSGLSVHPVMKVGSPWQTLAEQIDSTKADMVVMGTSGTDGDTEELVGSNTEKTVRNSSVPVIAIRRKVDADSIKNIAFATSLHEGHQDLINNLKKLQECFGATLHIVRVNTPNSFSTDREVRKLMDKYVAVHELSNYTENTYDDTTEEDGIVSFAEDKDMDMIAMATHGRTGFLHLLSGSVAEDVVNHSKRPVWTFKV